VLIQIRLLVLVDFAQFIHLFVHGKKGFRDMLII
jgi:hypothetical protein